MTQINLAIRLDRGTKSYSGDNGVVCSVLCACVRVRVSVCGDGTLWLRTECPLPKVLVVSCPMNKVLRPGRVLSRE